MDARGRVAREAARLLYTGSSEEYRQAKDMAARSLGLDSMPSNFEVAVELDLLVEQSEGEGRRRLLMEMRIQALKIMRALSDYSPLLIGSVWRGTARKGSDIDITAYAVEHKDVESELIRSGYIVERSEEVDIMKECRMVRSRHITIPLEAGFEAEVVVRPPEERGEADICEIYGDLKRGLNLHDLERLMKTDPLRKFVPRRRSR